MEDRNDLLAKVEPERRNFLKKIAVAAAFAAPTIATFSVDGMRKKAFAQLAYDPPEVIDPLIQFAAGQVEVNFTQPMNPAYGSDSKQFGAPLSCRTIVFNSFAYLGCEWNATNTKQIITFSGGCEAIDDLNVTYNWGSCIDKFKGANGLELVPYSGHLVVYGSCPG